MHREVIVPETGYDLIVHTGDFTTFGKGMQDFFDWYGSLTGTKLLILGNHEYPNPDYRIKANAVGIILLTGGQSIEVNGVVIAAIDSGSTHTASAAIDGYQGYADVILSHSRGPIEELPQLSRRLKHQGVRTYLHGHIHEEGRQEQTVNQVRWINGSLIGGECVRVPAIVTI